MSEALAVYDRIENPIEAAEKLGGHFANSNMFGCSNVSQGTMLALMCMIERKTPTDLLRTFHLIDGKLSMRADAMLAGFRKLGGDYLWLKDGSDGVAALAMSYKQFKDYVVQYTAADATKAGYLPAQGRSGWAKNPDAMLRARVVSKALRMIAPEVVAGTYTPEEVEDFTGQTIAGNATIEQPGAPAATLQSFATPAATEAPKRGRPRKEPEPTPAPALAQPAAATTAAPAQAVTVSPAPPLTPKQAEVMNAHHEAAAQAAKPAAATVVETKPAPVTAPATPAAAAAPVDSTNPMPTKREAVLTIMGDKVDEIMQFIRANARNNGGQGSWEFPKNGKVDDLDDAMCERILSRPDPFLRAFQNWLMQQPKK